MVEHSDILVGIFWTRFGSPTGIEGSGTVEEIKQFMQFGRPTLLYFSTWIRERRSARCSRFEGIYSPWAVTNSSLEPPSLVDP